MRHHVYCFIANSNSTYFTISPNLLILIFGQINDSILGSRIPLPKGIYFYNNKSNNKRCSATSISASSWKVSSSRQAYLFTHRTQFQTRLHIRAQENDITTIFSIAFIALVASYRHLYEIH